MRNRANAETSDLLQLAHRLIVVRRRDHIHPGDDERFGLLCRRAELLSVHGDRRFQRLGSEMGGEGVRQSEHGGELRAEQRRTEHVQRDIGPAAGCRLDARNPRRAGQVALEFEHILRKVVGGQYVAPQGAGGGLVTPGRSTKTKIDPTGMKTGERAELLHDHQRRMVRQHDAAGTEPDRARLCSDVRDQHARRRRCDGGHVVVLGVPDPRVAMNLGLLRGFDGAQQRVPGGRSTLDDRQVQDGQRHA